MLYLWKFQGQVKAFEKHLPTQGTEVLMTFLLVPRGFPSIFPALYGCLYIFAYLESNFLCGMIYASLFALVMTLNMICWHPTVMDRFWPSSGVCIQKNVHTYDGGCWKCGFGSWRYLLWCISPHPSHNISLQ